MDDTRALDLLLERCSAPMWLVDVGARWGANATWDRLRPKASILCFEPDPDECARLQAGSPPHVRYVAAALAASAGERDMIVTAEPACSSFLPPVEALHTLYPPLAIMQPRATRATPCQVLDDVVAREGIGRVTALKLDTQGTELDILRGSVAALAGCSFVDVEVQFNPLYQGAGLFCDLDRFLRDQGLVLWRIESLVHYAPVHMPAASSHVMIAGDPGPLAHHLSPNGQLFWGQAHYVRADHPLTGPATLPAQPALEGAIMAATYGYWDLALDILRRSPHAGLVDDILPLLGPAASASG